MSSQGAVLASATHRAQPVVIGGFESFKFGQSMGSMDSSIWGLATQGTTETYDMTKWLCRSTVLGEARVLRSDSELQPPVHFAQYLWEECWVQTDSICPVGNATILGCTVSSAMIMPITCDRVIYMGALEANVLALQTLCDVLQLVKAVSSASAQLILLTHNTHVLKDSWEYAGIWGFAQSVRNEIPSILLQCVELSDGEISAVLKGLTTTESRMQDSELMFSSHGNVLSKHVLVRSSCSLAHCASSCTYLPATIAGDATSCMGSVIGNHTLDLDCFKRSGAAMELLAEQYLKAAMKTMTVHDVAHDHHRRLWNRWHNRLQNSEVKITTSFEKLVEDWPELASSLAMLERCGPQLVDVLTGAIDPLVLLFPGGSMDEAEAVYADAPNVQLYNTLVQAALKSLMADAVNEQAQLLRLFEIGGGTGGTTTSVLPMLTLMNTEYWFTDLSKAFLRRAQTRWQVDYPFVRYGIFDAEKDPAEQGFAAQSFDAVIAVNVLHATRNLHRTLANTHRLLRPGALLVLSEITEVEHTAVVDCTWGLTDGWWIFRDGRTFAPQSRDQWQRWFDSSGFGLQTMQPELGLGNSFLRGQTVFVASARPQEKFVGGHLVSHSHEMNTKLPFLICGGLGGIGLETCRWMAERGAMNIWLTSRSGAVKDTHTHATLDKLMQYPVGISACACDATDLSQVRQMVKGRTFAGTVQSTLVTAGALAYNLTLKQMATAWSPKVVGVKLLHVQDQFNPHSWFLTYSSTASLLGPAGDSAYAACNAALDAFVIWRRGLGQASVNVQWGLWEGIGSAERYGKVLAQRTGINKLEGLSAEICLRALTTACTFNQSLIVTTYTSFEPLMQTNQLAAGLQNELQPVAFVALKVDGTSAPIIHGDFEASITEVIQINTGIELDLHDPVMEAGVDSLMMIQLQSALQKLVGSKLQLSITLLFDYPTVHDLAQYFRSALDMQTKQVLPDIAPEPLSMICIEQASAYIPGNCSRPVEWWAQLFAGADAIQQIPERCFDAASFNIKCPAHLLGHVQHFDNAIFRISTTETAVIDPNQRLLLEVGHITLAAAGHTRQSLMGSPIGVFVGACAAAEWGAVIKKVSSPFVTNASGGASLVGRVSFVFGLKGPCISANTACSSSLVAIDVALQNIQNHRCSHALAGGTHLILQPSVFVVLDLVGALAHDGLCKTFDAAANGLGRGEACCMLLLNTGISVCPRLQSTHLNQDGRSASMAAPNGPSQVQLLQAARLSECQSSETHGTGTALGDPIEVGALRVVFGTGSNMVLGATKSRLGHTEGAAGMVSVLSAVLVLEGHCLSPNLHLRELNQKLELKSFLVVIPSGVVPLVSSSGGNFFVGASSFGMSGTNAHAALTSSKAEPAVIKSPQRVVKYQHTAYVWWDSCDAASALTMSLLGVSTPALETGIETQWERSWPSDTCSYMAQHRVGCTPVAPGTGYLCMVREALMMVANAKDGEVRVSKGQFTVMLFLDGPAPVVRVCVEPEGEYSSAVRIESSVAAAGWVQHASVAAILQAEVVGDVTVDSISDASDARVTGASFCGSTTNDYMGGCRSVGVVWSVSRDDRQLAVSSKVGRGALQQHVVLGLSLVELQQLQLVMWMGGSSRQTAEMSDAEQDGRPCMFVEVKAEGEADQHDIVLSNMMLEWVAQVGGSGGRSTYLRSGQLEVLRTGQHLYDTAWEALPVVVVGSGKEQEGVTMVWSGSDADGALLSEAAFGPVDFGVVQIEEVFEGLGSGGVLWCWLGGDAVPGSVLQALQAAVTSMTSVWLVSESGAAAGCWGLAKSINAEVGQLVRCVEVFEAQCAAVSAVLLARVTGSSDAELSIGGNGLLKAHRLHQVVAQSQHTRHLYVAHGGGLVSGGTGGLGLLTAHWLMQHGVARVLLLSRSGCTDRGACQQWACATATQAGTVCVELCDMRSEWQLCRSAECGNSKLGNIVHSAGVLADALLPNQTQAGLQRVWAPKAQAAWSLHQASCEENMEVDQFVLFSSVAALFGNTGQANYAAANASLDGLVRLRHEQGLCGSSVQWGAWAGVGMAVDSGLVEQLEAQGTGAVREQQGMCALELAMSGPGASGVMGMLPLVWPVLLGLMDGEVPNFVARFARLVGEEVCIENTVAETALVVQLSSQEDAVAQRTALESMVLSKVHEVSGVSVTPHDPLMESGVDSLASTELKNSLQRELGTAVKLPSTLMFDYPTSASIAEVIARYMYTKSTPVPVHVTSQVSVSTKSEELSVAISGMDCLAPGGSFSCSEFWDLLSSATDSIVKIPLTRFDVDALAKTANKLHTKTAHFVEGLEYFDNAQFHISPAEAAAMDPHQRKLLEVGYSTLTRADKTRQSLMGSAVGVFVGVMTEGDWPSRQGFNSAGGSMSPFAANGVGAGALAGRVSFVLGLKG